VLTSHEQSDHHVGNFVVGNRSAVLVDAVHEIPDHVLGILLATSLSSRPDNLQICAGHLLVGDVSAAIVGKGCPWKHEVDGREAHVQVVEEVGEAGVKLVAHFLALERARCSEDCDLGHGANDIEGSVCALEACAALDVVFDFGLDELDVGLEGIGGEAVFHELRNELVMWIEVEKQGVHAFFCSMSFELGQSYTTSFPKTGVVRGL
jgi:hypothetical protein